MGIGRPAPRPQILGAPLGGTGLRQDTGRSGQFRGCLLGLQFEIDLIEGGERLADLDDLPDFYEALRHLPRNAEAHVGFDTRPDSPDKGALRRAGLIMDRRHQYGAALFVLLGLLLGASTKRKWQQERSRQN